MLQHNWQVMHKHQPGLSRYAPPLKHTTTIATTPSSSSTFLLETIACYPLSNQHVSRFTMDIPRDTFGIVHGVEWKGKGGAGWEGDDDDGDDDDAPGAIKKEKGVRIEPVDTSRGLVMVVAEPTTSLFGGELLLRTTMYAVLLFIFLSTTLLSWAYFLF